MQPPEDEGSSPSPAASGGPLRRRYEHHGTPHAFVELTRHGAEIGHRYGGLGRRASGERTERHESPEAASAALERLHRRLLAKGYWPGHHHPGLIEAIRRAPDDPGGYAVYADWLDERDDPRAALVRGGAMRDEDRWQLVPHPVDPPATVSWHLGFARELSFQLGHWLSYRSAIQGAVGRWLRHPSGHFVQRITIAPPRYTAPFVRHTWDRGRIVVLVGCVAAHAPCIRELVLPGGFARRLAGRSMPPWVRFA